MEFLKGLYDRLGRGEQATPYRAEGHRSMCPNLLSAHAPGPGTRNPKSGTRDPEPESRNPGPATRNPDPETRTLESSVEGERVEDFTSGVDLVKGQAARKRKGLACAGLGVEGLGSRV